MAEHDFVTTNPVTEEVVEGYRYMSDDEVSAAIERCHEALREWRLRSLEDRARVIAAIGEKLREKKDEFAALMTRETGKLLKDGGREIDLCAGICDYTAKMGPEILADEEREVPSGGKGYVVHAPLGVIYGIQPWNFPAYQAVRYSISAMMVGNGVLLKHARNCTGSGLFLRDLYEEAGLPEGLFTVLLVSHDQSDKVIEHELVRGVTLTGSDTAGRTVAQKAGSLAKKTVLELGSNDAYVVLDDADLAQAVKTCVIGRIYNNGQTCVNAKRFIVTEKNYDAFVENYVKAFEGLKIGDPTEEGTQVGPIVSKDQRDQVHEQVTKSVEKGARALTGGKIPEGKGYFYPPTVLVDVQKGQPAYDDELFGPVASIIRAKDDEDAMRLANDSRYGLGGGIFSRDEKRAFELAARHFDTGMVFVNNYNVASPMMPFGGVKDSGYGREHGEVGMTEFANVKSIVVQKAA